MVICIIVYIVLFGLYYWWKIKYLEKWMLPMPDDDKDSSSCSGYIQEIYTVKAGFGFKERVVTRYRVTFLYGERVFEVFAPGIKDLEVGDIIEVVCPTTSPYSAEAPIFTTYQMQFLRRKARKQTILLFVETVCITQFVFAIMKFNGVFKDILSRLEVLF